MLRSNPKRILSLPAALGASLICAPAAFADVAPVRDGVSQVAITLVGDDGGACLLDHDSAAAGPVTFTVTNLSAPAISELEVLSGERIIGEKENLAPGLPASRFTITLDGGAYRVYCPNATEEMTAFTVTGEARRAVGSTADALEEGTQGYARYVDGMVDAMVVAVRRLAADIDKGDLGAAKTAYANARPFYERIESDVEGFIAPGFAATDNAGNLDYLIDMRESNLDPAVGWSGFHAIERDLFGEGRIDERTKKTAVELQANVETLAGLVKGLTYAPEDLANGAAGLLEEVQSGKISGEEEAYSHLDLVDFAANVEGAQQAFAFLQPGMETIDPELSARVGAQFVAMKTMLKGYADAAAPGGYAPYTDELRKSDAKKLSQAIQSLQEPLAQIAEKVATAG